MEKTTNLYLITTSGMGDFYVTGDDPGEAQQKLLNKIEKESGFAHDKQVINIRFLGHKSTSSKLQRFVD